MHPCALAWLRAVQVLSRDWELLMFKTLRGNDDEFCLPSCNNPTLTPSPMKVQFRNILSHVLISKHDLTTQQDRCYEIEKKTMNPRCSQNWVLCFSEEPSGSHQLTIFKQITSVWQTLRVYAFGARYTKFRTQSDEGLPWTTLFWGIEALLWQMSLHC